MAESSVTDLNQMAAVARQLRVDSIRMSTRAGSGHPTSSLSAADLMAALVSRHMRCDWSRPELAGNDHLIFSKGHASPLYYALLRVVGAIGEEEMMTYREFGSRLQGHPTPALPWVDVATGSLGQGLPIAVGVALAGRSLDRLPFHVYTLCGDSELAEGSIWEGLDKAAHYGLGNFTAIFDVNRLGQRGETEFGWALEVYRRRVEAFGCRALVVDGHDLAEIDQALSEARQQPEVPSVIIARTVKGKGVPEIENLDGWHGKALPEDLAERAVSALGGPSQLRVQPPAPEREGAPPEQLPVSAATLPRYGREDKVATRKAYVDALLALGALPQVVALDGEVSNSTHADEFAAKYPDRFFEVFIAEQMLVAAAVGMWIRGYVPFASTFAAFFSRAQDFIRMASISGADIRLVGSHAGVEIGADGPSQMALEDLSNLRAVHGSTVLYPCDPNQTARLVAQMVDRTGVVFMRTTRGAYPTLYGPDEEFLIGGARVLRSSPQDQVALIGAGVTLHGCLAAADELAGSGVTARVIDLYSVKPVDLAVLEEACEVTGGKLVVVEDHHPEGGLGGAVMEALSLRSQPPQVAQCAVRRMPGSGTPAELMDFAEISPPHIVRAALRLLGR